MDQQRVLFEEVLLVEDEPAHALLIERALRGLVAGVSVCGSVSDAKARLKERAFDLIISDLNLPDLRSDAVVRALRQESPKLPLLVLTSSATLTDGIAAMRAGASDFLVKNFDASFRDVLQLSLSRISSALAVEREREQLARDRDLLREAIESSNDGLAVADLHGGVRYCNSGFQAFLDSIGVKTRNVLDIPPTKILRGHEVVAKLGERIRTMEPGGVWTVEVIAAEDDETAFDVTVSAVRERGADPVVLLWVRDIRERRRRERFQREILSTTTHDLKGPLGAIAVSCDVLLHKPPVDEKALALVERISSSASSAIHLIEEFLSLRRMEEGAFVLHPKSNDLQRIADKVIDSFRLSAKTRGVELVLESVGNDVVGCVDPLGFERVLSNLVSNAIKFSPKASEVRIAVQRSGGGVVLSVQDFGSGMEPSDAQRLFNRYGRLASHAQVSGTGLGLFIVKCIVSAHGGSIDVTSSLGKGSTFEVFFPDAPPLNERGEVLCLDFA
jgi:sigma-B regulation protein RsbU (phosphoserine phosphatase)